MARLLSFRKEHGHCRVPSAYPVRRLALSFQPPGPGRPAITNTPPPPPNPRTFAFPSPPPETKPRGGEPTGVPESACPPTAGDHRFFPPPSPPFFSARAGGPPHTKISFCPPPARAGAGPILTLGYGRISIGVPSGTARQISSISKSVTAMHPAVQSVRR